MLKSKRLAEAGEEFATFDMQSLIRLGEEIL